MCMEDGSIVKMLAPKKGESDFEPQHLDTKPGMDQ